MKILLFSDLHAHNYEQFSHRLPNGRNSRFQDCLDVIAQATKIVHDRDVRAVFFLGDLFHSRVKIDVDVLAGTIEYMRSLALAAPTYLLVGNHDQYTRVGEVHSTSAFERDCIVVDEPCLHTLHGVSVLMYPHTSDVQGMKKWLSEVRAADFLFIHQGISEAAVGPYDMHVKTELSIHDLPFHKFKLCAAGDFHKRQFMVQGKFHYIGSPLQLNFGERDEVKAFSLIDTETWEVETIPTNAPRFYLLDYSRELVVPGNPDRDFYRITCYKHEEEAAKKLAKKVQLLLRQVEKQEKPRVNAEMVSDDKMLLSSYINQHAGELDTDELLSEGLDLLLGSD